VTGATVANGSTASGTTGGAALSPTFTGYSGTYGKGGNRVTAGTGGIVLIRYEGSVQRGSGGTYSTAGGLSYHTYTTPGSFTFTG
jgi:hypothetical protein